MLITPCAGQRAPGKAVQAGGRAADDEVEQARALLAGGSCGGVADGKEHLGTQRERDVAHGEERVAGQEG